MLKIDPNSKASRLQDKLDAFVRIRNIVAKYSDELEYKMVCDE